MKKILDVLDNLVRFSKFQMKDCSPYTQGTSEKILAWYQPFAVLLTCCGIGKPFSHSFIHYGINKALYEKGLLHQIERWYLGPVGTIPSTLENTVPYCCYDWDDGEADVHQIEALRKALKDYYTRWIEQYILPTGKKVVLYFRKWSDVEEAISSIDTLTKDVMFPVWVGKFTEDDLREETLDGEYCDPDCSLIHPTNLDRLTEMCKHCLQMIEK